MAVVITAGQRAECTQFEAALEKVRVPRTGAGRPRRTGIQHSRDTVLSASTRHPHVILKRRTSRPDAEAGELMVAGPQASTQHATSRATPSSLRSTS